MEPLSQKILNQIKIRPGITDRWLAETIFGQGTPQQRVNGECRKLAAKGLIARSLRSDGIIGNYPSATGIVESKPELKAVLPAAASIFSEDEVKRVLEAWLKARGWSVRIAWARALGVDIDAHKNDLHWIIEVKGGGSLNPMRVNYFLCVLGETLQRMDDLKAKYSIALPDLRQFRNLWARLPRLAKERTTISALFVKPSGEVEEIGS